MGRFSINLQFNPKTLLLVNSTTVLISLIAALQLKIITETNNGDTH